jgi:acetyl esterase/lipase
MAPSRSHADLSALDEIAPDFKKHSKARLVVVPDWTDGIDAVREFRAKHLRSLQHLLPIPSAIPDVFEEKDVFIPADDGHQIRARVYALTKPDKRAYPVIVLYHEGGWCFGDLSDEEMNARMFVRDLGVVCLNVEYRPAPENQVLSGIDDCNIALKAAATVPGVFHRLADPKLGSVVGGSSAGGNISAMLAHRAREDRLNPPVTGQWLSCPFLILTDLVPEKYSDEYVSIYENQDDPVLGPMSPEKEAGEHYSDRTGNFVLLVRKSAYDHNWCCKFR